MSILHNPVHDGIYIEQLEKNSIEREKLWLIKNGALTNTNHYEKEKLHKKITELQDENARLKHVNICDNQVICALGTQRLILEDAIENFLKNVNISNETKGKLLSLINEEYNKVNNDSQRKKKLFDYFNQDGLTVSVSNDFNIDIKERKKTFFDFPDFKIE